jgi:hypothetical protein
MNRYRSVSLPLLLAATATGSALAQEQAGHSPLGVVASRTASPPAIDGRLTDECWQLAAPARGLRQINPDEGEPATEETEIRVLFDDSAIYVAARMFDKDAQEISRRLSKRDDDADADRISIYLDPMHDHLTGAVFRVSASGVQDDSVLYNDTWSDGAWDAVWHSAVSADDQGWSAELRIPFSQLRFAAGDHQTWGLNVERFIRRKNETDWLELVPKKESGTVSRMAHLSGLDGIRPKRVLELLPYTAARSEFVQPPTSGNPFNDGSRTFASAGLDLKWGVTSNLTLNGTLNPDFGQVEVDPAVVNLSAFETFFEEKRPFFLEGSQIFGNFGQGGANNYWGFNTSDPNIFYSRRIGRAPQLFASGDFTDPPSATTILGAGKLSGKTRGGWSIGLLEAVTEREEARVFSGAANGRIAVEPLTNYLVARVKQDGRRAGAGFIGTAVNRRLDSVALEAGLSDQAYVAGVDGYYFLSDALDWVLAGKIAASRIVGSQAAITRSQLAVQRYYQRPDAPQVSFDPARTSLSGFTGRINLNKNSGLRQFNAALWGASPGFESNDLGFLGTGDRAGAHSVYFFRNVTPGDILRERSAWIAKWWTWNFNRDLQGDGVQGNMYYQFLNYWSFGVNAGINRTVQDDRLTRGGPSALSVASRRWNLNLNTDSRQRLSINAFTNYSWNDAEGWSRNSGVTVNLKPSPKVSVSTGPQYNSSLGIAQYVRSVVDPTATDTYGGRYVFGAIDQQQLTLTTRVNLIFTPRHSLQVFAQQPLLAAGDYDDFKELALPRTFDFLHYGSGSSTLAFDPRTRIYTVDPDASGPAAPFTFGDPDFNFKSLRLNVVYRWELKPGSAFYAVWTRQQQDLTNPGSFAFRQDAHALFAAPGDDVFLVKMAYWIGR